jgi:hypothetical protein
MKILDIDIVHDKEIEVICDEDKAYEVKKFIFRKDVKILCQYTKQLQRVFVLGLLVDE